MNCFARSKPNIATSDASADNGKGKGKALKKDEDLMDEDEDDEDEDDEEEEADGDEDEEDDAEVRRALRVFSQLFPTSTQGIPPLSFTPLSIAHFISST